MQPRASMSSRSADPLKQHACIQVIVKFVDGNVRTFYSRDIDCLNQNKWKYKHVAYWVQYWKYRIEKESPTGWEGRVSEAAIFHSFDGNRGDKILQWIKARGGWQKNA
ncbi:hypothetical protein [Spirosoma sp.]|uniref:hypothetical protein n=1 Tax=Spirosoma sp. TaxID=1899569 RepID=UPI002638FD87|nr:hypothetical protein [Spirosoma sp.]MCX6216535.1 hypothetical protein [Spirosoma sp.]